MCVSIKSFGRNGKGLLAFLVPCFMVQPYRIQYDGVGGGESPSVRGKKDDDTLIFMMP